MIATSLSLPSPSNIFLYFQTEPIPQFVCPPHPCGESCRVSLAEVFGWAQCFLAQHIAGPLEYIFCLFTHKSNVFFLLLN